MIQAVVRLTLFQLHGDDSAQWEKPVAFAREPAAGEYFELWDDGFTCSVAGVAWRYDGMPVVMLRSLAVGDRPQKPWDSRMALRMECWAGPDGPTPEKLTAAGWTLCEAAE